MDTLNEGSYTNYFPVRRIAQACTSCRQKKSRCTGDHPACGNCRRLGIECVYPKQTSKQVSSPTKRTDAATTVEQSALDGVTRRLAAIEDNLIIFGAQLESISHRLESFVNGVKHIDRGSPVSDESPRKKPRVAPSQTGLGSGNAPDPNPVSAEQVALPREVLFAIVDLYFTYCHNQPYSFFHEANFRHRLSQGTLPEHLLFAILASALRFSRHPYFTGSLHEKSVRYANQSWKLVVSNDFIVDRTADISVVQTIALLALFDFTAGQTRHGAAWVKIGMAVRIAQDLGLMLDAAHHLPYVDQEERRRVFWSVYLLDRLVSCGRGRPPAIVDASCQLLLPCDDAIWKEGRWQKTLTLDELLNRTMVTPDHQGHFAHVIAMAYVLGKSAQYMLQDLNIRSEYPPWDRGSDFAAMESDLLHLETRLEMHKSIEEILAPCVDGSDNMDHQSAGHIIFSRVLFHLCHCILNHPFLLRRRIETTRFVAPASFLARAFDVGWQHARCMIELIRHIRDLGCVFQSSFSGYCIVVAGSIAVLHMHNHKVGIGTAAQTVMQEAVTLLDEVGQFWNNVWNMAQILRQAAENALGFELCTDQAQIAPLSEADTNIMWRLVDYSTMSDEAAAGLVQSKNQKEDLWLDSWIDLFGTMDNAFEFEMPMVDVSSFDAGSS